MYVYAFFFFLTFWHVLWRILSILSFPPPHPHFTLVRREMTTLNEVPGTSKSSSIFYCCFFFLFLIYFPRKNITEILLLFHLFYTKYGVPWWRWTERMIFFSKFQGKNQSDCKEIKPVNPKGKQSWIFIGRTDAEAETPTLWPPDAKNWLIGKDPDAKKDWRQEEKGRTEDMMVRRHHWLDGYEFEQALGVGDGQGSLACYRQSDMTEQLNWTEGKNVIKTFDYEIDTTLGSFNLVSLKFNRHDSERRKIWSNSTCVVEVGPDPTPLSSLPSRWEAFQTCVWDQTESLATSCYLCS